MPKLSWESMKVSMMKNFLFWDNYLVIYRKFRCLEEDKQTNSCYYSSNLLKENHVLRAYEIRRSECQSPLTSEFFYANTKGTSVILFRVCSFRNAAILMTGTQLHTGTQKQNL